LYVITLKSTGWGEDGIVIESDPYMLGSYRLRAEAIALESTRWEYYFICKGKACILGNRRRRSIAIPDDAFE